MFDLAKAYDKVDRLLLLEVISEWLGEGVVEMVRAMLCPSTARTRGTPRTLQRKYLDGFLRAPPRRPFI